MLLTEAGKALLETFSHVRIINLKSREDRRRDMVSELGRLGISVDGDRVAFHDACRPDSPGEFPSIGARGCFLSHLAVLEEAQTIGASSVLILEDDLDFAKDAESHIPETLACLEQKTWSIFYGGYEQYLGPVDDVPLTRAAPGNEISTTHFLGLDRNTIALVVPFFRTMASRLGGDPAGGPMHVDGAYSWFRRANPNLHTWLATPALGHQRSSRTDIHPHGFFDRTPGLRDLVSTARRLKRALS